MERCLGKLTSDTEKPRYSSLNPRVIKSLMVKRPKLLSSFENTKVTGYSKDERNLLEQQSSMNQRDSLNIKSSLKLSRAVIKGAFCHTTQEGFSNMFGMSNQRVKISERISLRSFFSCSKRSVAAGSDKIIISPHLKSKVSEAQKSFHQDLSKHFLLARGKGEVNMSPLETKPETPKIPRVHNYQIEVPDNVSVVHQDTAVNTLTRQTVISEEKKTTQINLPEGNQSQVPPRVLNLGRNRDSARESSQHSARDIKHFWPQRWVPKILLPQNQHTCPLERQTPSQVGQPARREGLSHLEATHS